MSTAASQALVQKLYVAYYGRPADPVGLEAWALAIDANEGQVSTAIVNAFGASAESTALFGNMSTSQKVNAIYKQLFGRDAEPAGLLAWTTAINSGRVSAAGAALEILNGAAGDDKTTINNKLSAAAAFTAALDTTAEITAYSGDTVANAARSFLAGVTTAAPSTDAVNTAVASVTNTSGSGSNEAGKSYVLTTAQDVLTGTNSGDFFRAVAGVQVGQQDQTTLNSSDIIDGGAGADSLIVNMTGPSYNGGARIKNIETLQVGTNLAAATFDYNVNAGSNEVTEVTTIVADQINVGEQLTVNNILKTGSAIPTLKWDNEAGSTAGTFATTFRESAVSGDTEVKLVLDDVKALNSTATTGRFNLGTGANASVETLRVVSQGSTTNTLNASSNNDGTAVDLVGASNDGSNDNGALKTVIVEGAQAFGKAAELVTDTTEANYGLMNRTLNGADDLGATTKATAANLVSLAATVTTLDASAATGDTNIRFTGRVDGAEVAVTYKGGKANDYVEFQQGNVNATGGDGNDTFAFVNAQNNSTLTTADTIVGGAGTDTIQMGVNGVGSYNLETTEFNNKSGIDVLDMRGLINTVKLSDAFVTGSDAGLTVRTDKIVQTSATSSANDSVNKANNFLEDQTTNTIDLTALAANRAVTVTGGSGSDRLLVNEVALNSSIVFDGGANAGGVSTEISKTATSADYDTLTVLNSAVLSRGDLSNIKGIEGIVLTENVTGNSVFTIELTEAFVLANTAASNTTSTSINDTILQIVTADAANGKALTSTDKVKIDVTDLFDSTTNALKTSLVGRAIDTNGVGATVSYVYKGTEYDSIPKLAAATNAAGSTFVSGADAARADVANSAAALPPAVPTYTPSGSGSTTVAGNTFTLTANSAVLLATGGSANVTPAGNLSSTADTINANINLNSAFIQDTTTGDGDVLNATLAATYTANQATILGIETLNLTGAGGSLNVAQTTGATAINLVNGVVGLTNVAATTPVTLNAGFAGTANLKSASAAAAADFAITLAGGSSTATVAFEDSAAAQLIAGSVVTANITANTTLARLADDDSAAAAAGGVGDLVVKGSGNLTVADLQFKTVSISADGYTGALDLTVKTASAANHALAGSTGNDTFNLTNTFTAVGDTVNGGAGSDTLKINDVAAVALTNVTNIENVVVSGSTATTVTTAAANLGLGETLNINGSALSGVALTTAGGLSAIYKLNITGSAQGDTLVAGAQADSVFGGEGADAITGGAGNDFIDLTEATSVIDTVVYASATDGVDTIKGFVSAKDLYNTDFATTKNTVGAGTTVKADVAAAAGAVTFSSANDVVNITGTLQAAITDFASGAQVLAAISGTSVSVTTTADKFLMSLSSGGNTYLYQVTEGADGDALLAAADVVLVGTFQGTAALVAADII